MAMHDKEGFIWFDGKLVPWKDANVHVLTHSLHYGLAAFEGVRAYETPEGTAIFRLQEHTERFFNSAKIFQMKIPYTFDEIIEAQKVSVSSNNLKSAYIRPLVFLGSEALGIGAKNNTVHVTVASWSWGAYMGEEAITNGIRVKTSSFTRHHVNVSMVRAKCSGYYVNSILAHQEAVNLGFEEALQLDVDGYVSEGPGENIFIVKNGVIYTPDVTSCLDGITRSTIITLAQDLGYTIKEKRITRDEVYCADEAFFTGTAVEVTPIRELDGRILGNGNRGPITEKVQKLYFDTVKGLNPNHREWLTLIK